MLSVSRVKNSKGMVIPIVVVALFIFLAIIMLYNSTLKMNRNQDLLIESDTHSYYMAEAGFQDFLIRLRKNSRYEDRFYKPETTTNSTKLFEQINKTTKGEFQWFVNEIRDDNKFSHLFLLVRGVFQNNSLKSVTIFKTNLRYMPPPPTPDGITPVIIVEAKQIINKKELLRYISDDRFKGLFKKNNQIPENINQLIKFLAENNLEDIDFATQADLLMAVSEIEVINYKISKFREYFLDINSNLQAKLNYYAKGIKDGSISPNNDNIDIPNLNELDPFLNSDGSDEAFLKIKNKYLDFNSQQKKAAFFNILNKKINTFANSLTYKVEGNLESTIPKNGDYQDLILQIENIKNKYPNFEENEIINELEKAGITLLINHERVSFKDFINSFQANFKPNLNLFDKGKDEDNLPKEVAEEKLKQNEENKNLDNLDNLEEEPSSTPGTTSISSTLARLESGEVEEDEAYEDILNELHDGFFVGVRKGKKFTKADNAASGFFGAYFERKKLDLESFRLQKLLTKGEEPKEAELRAYAKENPMPDRKLIQQVGSIIDKMIDSDQYQFFQNANVSSKPGTGASIWTQMEMPRESMREELITKLVNLRPQPKTNEEFIKVFDNSTWGDSNIHASLGVARDEYGNKLDEKMFLIDKKTGKRTYMIDYIRANMK